MATTIHTRQQCAWQKQEHTGARTKVYVKYPFIKTQSSHNSKAKKKKIKEWLSRSI